MMMNSFVKTLELPKNINNNTTTNNYFSNRFLVYQKEDEQIYMHKQYD